MNVSVSVGQPRLDGDTVAPGANRVYGTNAAGTKGWKQDPTSSTATVGTWQALPPSKYMTIPGSTGDQGTHPHVLFLAGGWNGYEWWMVTTPYNDSNNQLENPSIYCSNDGVNWVVPTGVTNPLVASPGSPNYNSDVHSWWERDGRMAISWREHITTDVKPSRYKVIYSSDGVTWTTPLPFLQNGIDVIDASACLEWVDNTLHYFAVEYNIISLTTRLVHRTGPDIEHLGALTACTLPTTQLGPERILWHVDVVRVKNMWFATCAIGNAPAQILNDLLLFYSSDGDKWESTGHSMCGETGNNNAWNEGLYKSCAVWNCIPPRLYYVGVEFGSATKHRIGVTALENPLVVKTPTEEDVIAGVSLKGRWLFADVVDRIADGASPGAPSSHPSVPYTVETGQIGILDSTTALGGMRIARTGSVATRAVFDVGRSPIYCGVTQDGAIAGWSLVMSYVDNDNCYYVSFDTTGQIYFQTIRSGVTTTAKVGLVERTLPERLAVRYKGTYNFDVYYNDRLVGTVMPVSPRPVGTKFGLYTNGSTIRWTNLWAKWETS